MLTEQLNRIKGKLELAKITDSELSVFGAKSHKYRLNAPLSRTELHAFERKHALTLPEAYALFLTELGNGGAGPYYGMYALGDDQAIEDDEAESCAGLINIGTQGCSYEMMLVATGEHRGKLLYMDMDSGQTFMAYEDHFLDWYERWLDETISKYEDSWFGMSRGGDDLELMALYSSTTDKKIRAEALQGMLKLPRIAEETVLFLIGEYRVCSGEIRRNALQVLTKLRPEQAEGLVRELLNSLDKRHDGAAKRSPGSRRHYGAQAIPGV